jgi:hypothetical protein
VFPLQELYEINAQWDDLVCPSLMFRLRTIDGISINRIWEADINSALQHPLLQLIFSVKGSSYTIL